MTERTGATVLTIEPLGDAPAVLYAADELRRYLRRMLPAGERALLTGEPGAGAGGPVLRLGTYEALEEAGVPHAPWPSRTGTAPADPSLDDAVAIAVEGGAGYIGGPNPRSVLIGVYRLLRERGCAWVRPGPAGERVPACTLADLGASISEAAAYRHRALCIEGAVSYDNVASLIDWAPKVGLNGYFTQFRESYIFFERWYAHRNNPLKPSEPFGVERAREFMEGIVGEVARRGLLYHAVGHGWTCEPLGIAGLGWDAESPTLSPETTALLAEVNGVRALWRGVPLNTNLCYSNPAVREMVVGSIVDYLADHPEVDLLHFWLADGSNNQCECPACRDTRPADYYVMMLNALDRALAARGIPTRIVFLVYVDLLWPPERERIENPDRFVLMFAPITRSYRETFTAAGTDEPAALPPYVRNRLTFPADPAENVAFLRAWQDAFPGDSFDFDYHLWRGHYLIRGTSISPGSSARRRRAGRHRVERLCLLSGPARVLPTPLPMHVLARRLWDREADLAAFEAETLADAFGEDAPACREYLEAVSEAFRALEPLLGAEGDAAAGALPALARLGEALDAAQAPIARNLAHEDPCVAQSWAYLAAHRRHLVGLAGVLAARAEGRSEVAAERWRRVEHDLQAHEDALQPALDVWGYLETMRRRLGYVEMRH